jgi:hypothetical protein
MNPHETREVGRSGAEKEEDWLKRARTAERMGRMTKEPKGR